MNTGRLLLAAGAAFVLIFGFEFLFHGVILKSQYEASSELWRAQVDCIFPAMFGGQFLLGFFFCVGYAVMRNGPGNSGATGCPIRGMKFGAAIGAMAGSGNIIMYAVQPLPQQLVIYWFVGAVIEMALVGFIIALVYKPKAASPVPQATPE